jgi:hypothetical protein
MGPPPCRVNHRGEEREQGPLFSPRWYRRQGGSEPPLDINAEPRTNLRLNGLFIRNGWGETEERGEREKSPSPPSTRTLLNPGASLHTPQDQGG